MARSKTEETPKYVWLDYKGHTGPDHRHAHDGEHAIMRESGDPILVAPGLNKLSPEDGAAAKGTKNIAETDENLRGYESASALRDLAERTQSPDALEHILDLEMAKPQSGPASTRRSGDLVELLERRIELYGRRKVINLGGIRSQAENQAAVAPKAAAG